MSFKSFVSTLAWLLKENRKISFQDKKTEGEQSGIVLGVIIKEIV